MCRSACFNALDLRQRLTATLAALNRDRAARNPHQVLRARHDMRTWQVERRKRTRHDDLDCPKARQRGWRTCAWRIVTELQEDFEVMVHPHPTIPDHLLDPRLIDQVDCSQILPLRDFP